MYGVMKIIFNLDQWEELKMSGNNFYKLWNDTSLKWPLVEKIILKLGKQLRLDISSTLQKKIQLKVTELFKTITRFTFIQVVLCLIKVLSGLFIMN